MRGFVSSTKAASFSRSARGAAATPTAGTSGVTSITNSFMYECRFPLGLNQESVGNKSRAPRSVVAGVPAEHRHFERGHKFQHAVLDRLGLELLAREAEVLFLLLARGHRDRLRNALRVLLVPGDD